MRKRGPAICRQFECAWAGCEQARGRCCRTPQPRGRSAAKGCACAVQSRPLWWRAVLARLVSSPGLSEHALSDKTKTQDQIRQLQRGFACSQHRITRPARVGFMGISAAPSGSLGVWVSSANPGAQSMQFGRPLTLVVLLGVTAGLPMCGSDDSKKVVTADGGEAGAQTASSGGSDSPSLQGGSDSPSLQGGNGGAPSDEPAGGTSGAPASGARGASRQGHRLRTGISGKKSRPAEPALNTKPCRHRRRRIAGATP